MVLIELFEIHFSRIVLVISICWLDAFTPASLITTVRFSSAGLIFAKFVGVSPPFRGVTGDVGDVDVVFSQPSALLSLASAVALAKDSAATPQKTPEPGAG